MEAGFQNGGCQGQGVYKMQQQQCHLQEVVGVCSTMYAVRRHSMSCTKKELSMQYVVNLWGADRKHGQNSG